MITATSLKHPVMQERILNAVIAAQEKAQVYGYGVECIPNSKGDYILRLHMSKAGAVEVFDVTSLYSSDITGRVESALGQKFCELI